MSHPAEGVLRRLLDEPAGVATADGDHVATCEACARGLAVARDDADHVRAALATDVAAEVDLDAAWARLSAALADAPAPGRLRSAAPGGSRLRGALRRPVVAGVAVAVVVGGAGAAAANDWLQIFRTERIEPVSITAEDLNAIPDLDAYGEVEITGEPDVHRVPDAEAAEAETGLDVPRVGELPRGVSGEPTYQVGGEVSATFTFSAEQAARAADDAGEPLPPPPPEVDGSTVRLVAGPGVAMVWSRGGGVPTLVVGRATAPTASTPPTVSFDAVRDYLLSLPGLPDEVASALGTFNAEVSTLPLPLPADRVTTSTDEVDGATATVIETRDRTLAAVVWVEDGVVTVVAGPLDADEVLDVARDLR